MDNPLSIRNLTVSFSTQTGEVLAVDGLNLDLRRNEILGLIGESGSGKTATALSILKILPAAGKIKQGEILFEGENLLALNEAKMRKIRGKDIGIVFQDPLDSLNPLFKIRTQIAEALRYHMHIDKGELSTRIVSALKQVGIPEPEILSDYYPYQLSGGMRQRAMIAMALACEPKLLIADEPTSSLDVTIQAQILDLFMHLKKNLKISMIFITHNLSVIEGIADRIAIIKDGRIIESGLTSDIFNNPQQSYTKELINAVL